MDSNFKVHDSADHGALKPNLKTERALQRGDSSNDLQRGDPSKPATSPPLTFRLFLDWACFLLICGIAGAKGYSYSFGPSTSGDPNWSARTVASANGADSRKGDDLSKRSDGSKRSDDSKVSDASERFARSGLDSSTTAIEEFKTAKSAEDDARRPKAKTKAVLDFDRGSQLSSRRLRDGPLTEALWDGGQGVHLTLRLVLNGAEARLNEMFQDQPLAEASARESLGMAYLGQGVARRAVKQFERALALREAAQGVNHPDSAACRNRLAIAYRHSKLTTGAGRLFDQDVITPALAAVLAARGATLLDQKQPAEAVLELRESLTIRQKTQPDDWTTFDTKSMLGEALSELKEFSDAEPLLLSGYEGMVERANMIPPQNKPRLTRALDRLVKLYEDLGNKDETMRWRQQLELPHAARNPADAPPSP